MELALEKQQVNLECMQCIRLIKSTCHGRTCKIIPCLKYKEANGEE